MQAELTFPFKTEVTTVALLTAPHEAHNDCSKLSSKTEGRRRICSWALGLRSSGVASRYTRSALGSQVHRARALRQVYTSPGVCLFVHPKQ